MSREGQWNCIAYAKMLVKMGLALAVGGAILSGWGCGNGLVPAIVGGFVAGASGQTDGQDGLDGINCWDLNGDGINDDDEDVNADGLFTAEDCRGRSGTDGEVGESGATGPAGPAGTTGVDGRDGIDGSPGADGSDGFTDILDCWVVCPASFREPCEIVCPNTE